MKLKIAEDLALPLETVTQTIAMLAKRRAGKSYTMRRLVEQLFKSGQQVVLTDPKGDQWGVRSAADGKGPGLPIVILGGERGDVPLEPGGGEVVAKLVVEERVSVLLDLSAFRKHEVATFMTAFLENLYRLKAREMYRTPMMLVIDEADAIAPQKPQKGEERMLGAAEDIVRRGGQRGIGCVLVTQRSAVLNKNVLTQAQILVALRTIAPQDLAAMDAWIQVHGEPDQRKTLMESLPSLPVGDAWFWSPGWPTVEGIFKRVHVLPIETFDSGATPKPGEKPIEPKHAADVDLEALKRQMAATIERAKADDPRELRKQISDLKRQLVAASQGQNAAGTPIEKPVLTDADRVRLDKLQAAVTEAASLMHESLVLANQRFQVNLKLTFGEYEGMVQAAADKGRKAIDAALDRPGVQKILTKFDAIHPQPGYPKGHGPGHAVPPIRVASETRHEVKPHGAPSPLPLGEGKVLTAIAQYGSHGVSRAQLTVLTGYKRSSRDTYLQRLRERGFITVSGDQIVVTSDGILALGPRFEPLPTGDALRAHWLQRLPEGERRVIEVLVRAYPTCVARAAIDEATGYQRSSRDTYLQRLRARQLIVETGRGEVRASEELFS